MTRTLTWSLTTLIFIATAAVSQSGPSLQETDAWIDHTYNDERRGLFQQWNRDGKLYVEYIEDLAVNRCTMTRTVHEVAHTKGAEEIWMESNVVTFALGSIDPTTVNVVPFSNWVGSSCLNPVEVKVNQLDCSTQAEVRFKTRNSDRVIQTKMHIVFPKLTGQSHDSYSNSPDSQSAISMYDTAYARRFAKAFRHAVELCGGKPSAF